MKLMDMLKKDKFDKEWNNKVEKLEELLKKGVIETSEDVEVFKHFGSFEPFDSLDMPVDGGDLVIDLGEFRVEVYAMLNYDEFGEEYVYTIAIPEAIRYYTNLGDEITCGDILE